jgi:hypothetical protein
LVDPLGKEISSDSENVLVVGIDVTGSMSSWPAEIFDRLPLLYQTLSQYKPDLEIAFAAIGDASCDEYPLQINNFGKGLDLEDHINALFPEGGGGGQGTETYELFGYHILNHCKIPNAVSPFLLIYGDEKFYPNVNPDMVKHLVGDKLEDKIDSMDVWAGLMQRFNVFYLQKPFGSTDHTDSFSKEVNECWSKALGRERVIKLPNYERAIDVGIGIIAKYWGQYGDFTKNMLSRHDSTDVNSVHKSIRILPRDPNAPLVGTSKLLTAGSGKVSKKLVD